MAQEKKLVEDITSMEVDFAQWYTDVVKKAELAELEQALEEQQVVNDGLRYDLDAEDADSDEYAEKKARYELDYVKPGERVFYNVGGNN